MSTISSNDQTPAGTSRRVFLGWISVGSAAGVAAGCQSRDRATMPGPTGGPGHGNAHDHDAPGPAPSGDVHTNRDALQFFNHHQAMTVDAVNARIIPGTEDDPGASQAAVVFYVDHLLATHTGYPSPAYMEGPFAQTYEGAEPAPENGVVWVQAEELERYGRQTPFPPRDLYRMGLARLDALCQDRFGADFVDLNTDRQDQVLEAIEDEEDDDVARVFDEIPAGYFFDTMRTHTIEGFLSDPVYGGNRDMVGWRLVGFPGSRRSYSPRDLHDEDFDVTPQSLLDLPPFNADHDHAGHGAPTVRQRHPKGPID